ncbi:hypothetical protein F2P81_008317 [Scophthalmus maximus]|uniref:Uncharacterized protein n=1 Tax=Scophthalmus maximus TaxID=52904 RepID=A0A6A4TCZ9_SCOMX|nr:hypothetical protein F2P81_008317 [Scophthalmus maximus]
MRICAALTAVLLAQCVERLAHDSGPEAVREAGCRSRVQRAVCAKRLPTKTWPREQQVFKNCVPKSRLTAAGNRHNDSVPDAEFASIQLCVVIQSRPVVGYLLDSKLSVPPLCCGCLTLPEPYQISTVPNPMNYRVNKTTSGTVLNHSDKFDFNMVNTNNLCCLPHFIGVIPETAGSKMEATPSNPQNLLMSLYLLPQPPSDAKSDVKHDIYTTLGCMTLDVPDSPHFLSQRVGKQKMGIRLICILHRLDDSGPVRQELSSSEVPLRAGEKEMHIRLETLRCVAKTLHFQEYKLNQVVKHYTNLFQGVGTLRVFASSGTILTELGSRGLSMTPERKRKSRAAAFAVKGTTPPHAAYPFLLAGSVAHTSP